MTDIRLIPQVVQLVPRDAGPRHAEVRVAHPAITVREKFRLKERLESAALCNLCLFPSVHDGLITWQLPGRVTPTESLRKLAPHLGDAL